MQGDDITVCSLNVRGFSNNQKRRETFFWLKKKNSLSISYKKCIAQQKQKSVGNPNGYTQLFLQIFLAPEQVLAYFSTTILFPNFEILRRSRGTIYNS